MKKFSTFNIEKRQCYWEVTIIRNIALKRKLKIIKV